MGDKLNTLKKHSKKHSKKLKHKSKHAISTIFIICIICILIFIFIFSNKTRLSNSNNDITDIDTIHQLEQPDIDNIHQLEQPDIDNIHQLEQNNNFEQQYQQKQQQYQQNQQQYQQQYQQYQQQYQQYQQQYQQKIDLQQIINSNKIGQSGSTDQAEANLMKEFDIVELSRREEDIKRSEHYNKEIELSKKELDDDLKTMLDIELKRIEDQKILDDIEYRRQYTDNAMINIDPNAINKANPCNKLEGRYNSTSVIDVDRWGGVNWVLTDPDGLLLWQPELLWAGKKPYNTYLLNNGNVVVMDAEDKVLWSSDTANFGTPPYFLTIAFNGHLVIGDSTHNYLDISPYNQPKIQYTKGNPKFTSLPRLFPGMACRYCTSDASFNPTYSQVVLANIAVTPDNAVSIEEERRRDNKCGNIGGTQYSCLWGLHDFSDWPIESKAYWLDIHEALSQVEDTYAKIEFDELMKSVISKTMGEFKGSTCDNLEGDFGYVGLDSYGNLNIFDAGGGPMWRTAASGVGLYPYQSQISVNGFLVITDARGKIIFQDKPLKNYANSVGPYIMTLNRMNNLYFADFVGNFIRIGADNSMKRNEIKNPTVSDSNRYCTSDKKYKLTQDQLSAFNLIDTGVSVINGKYGFAIIDSWNGNCEIYPTNSNGNKSWWSGTHTNKEGEQYIGKLSWDGNFSIRNIAGAKYIHHWSSNTSKFGTPPYFMVLSHKGNLIISDSTGLLRNITDTYHHKIGNDINLDYPKRSYVTSTPLYIPSPELLNWANVEGISCTYLQGEFAYTELQLNGNFMIISTVPPYGILWQNGVNIRPQKITMSIRDDGILMEWDENGNFVWNSSGAGSSFGKPPYYMQLNANSHLIITDKDGNTMDITPNVNQPYYALYDNNTNKLYRNPKAGEGELSYCSNKPILPNLDTLEKGFKCTIS